MSDEEEPAPSAPGSEIRKTSLTKCDDEYTVSKRGEALSAKANTGKFSGLRAETPAPC